MGVCGCGKSTVGLALAARLRWPFLDGDDFHPASNVTKMASGTPLTDIDRAPWLDRLRDELASFRQRGERAVLACSALKRAYRVRLLDGTDASFVYLKADRDTVASRLALRTGHYMPAGLLDSQFAALEEPDDALVVDVSLPLNAQVAFIMRALCIVPAAS